MPRVVNKTKTGMVRVHRPDGMKYAEGETESGFQAPKNKHIGGVLATETAIRIALINFTREFGYKPLFYVAEVIVQNGNAHATIYDLEED